MFLPWTNLVTLGPRSLARGSIKPPSSVLEVLGEAVRKPRVPSQCRRPLPFLGYLHLLSLRGSSSRFQRRCPSVPFLPAPSGTAALSRPHCAPRSPAPPAPALPDRRTPECLPAPTRGDIPSSSPEEAPPEAVAWPCVPSRPARHGPAAAPIHRPLPPPPPPPPGPLRAAAARRGGGSRGEGPGA